MKTRVIVVEDEPLAREELRELLEDVEWIECVGEAGDGLSAVRMIDAERPGLVFLDVQLPELDGLEVLRRVEAMPHVVFTTAHDRYAVAAFELGALDYLLKPFGSDRLSTALERVRRQMAHPQPVSPAERAREVLATGPPLQRLFVRAGGRIIPLHIRDVERIEADGDYSALHAGGKRFLVHVPLGELEHRLDPDRFLRIHRSHIVNLEHVAALQPFDPHRMMVELASGARVLTSRSRTQALRSKIL
ncbi:MAG TPA: LytTR family DNA-binding domain-containing protein [Longimicrobium sp.]|jgi:two-component system LytT family response regulator